MTIEVLRALSGVEIKYWVSGATYVRERVARSPANDQIYVRIVTGAGTTDPASDTTNWKAEGRTGIKYRASGVITLSGSASTGTATISTVNTGKVRIFNLGSEGYGYADFGPGNSPFAMTHRLELTNSTTITAYRNIAGNATTTKVGWTLEEDY